MEKNRDMETTDSLQEAGDSIDEILKSLKSEEFYGPYLFIGPPDLWERAEEFNKAATTCIKCSNRVFKGDPDPVVRINKGKIEVMCYKCGKKYSWAEI